MKKFVLATVAVIAVMSLTLCLDAQPAGGGAGGGGGMGMGGGGMMGGGMGMGMGARGPVVRPDKAARVALIKELETQFATLKAAVDKAPDKDTAVTAESDQATTDKATAERQAETDAIRAIQTTLASLRGAATGGRGMMGGGASADVLSELRVLASAEKAAKTVARLDALIKEAQTRTGGRGAGRGGDAGAGRGAGRGGAGGF